MKALKLNDGDLVFDGYDLVLVQNDDEIIQQMSEVLTVNLKEWFLNEDHGIDFSMFFEKPFNPDLIETTIIEKLQVIEAVATVEITNFSFNNHTRKLSLSYLATKPNGEVVEGGI